MQKSRELIQGLTPPQSIKKLSQSYDLLYEQAEELQKQNVLLENRLILEQDECEEMIVTLQGKLDQLKENLLQRIHDLEGLVEALTGLAART